MIRNPGTLRIATRRSRLALWQAEHVKERLEALYGAPGSQQPGLRVERRGDRVLIRIENPWLQPATGKRAGNHMALDNIRERLMLFFDDEARLETRVEGARYQVSIELPYRSGPK